MLNRIFILKRTKDDHFMGEAGFPMLGAKVYDSFVIDSNNTMNERVREARNRIAGLINDDEVWFIVAAMEQIETQKEPLMITRFDGQGE